jgi:hypothetical protein
MRRKGCRVMAESHVFALPGAAGPLKTRPESPPRFIHLKKQIVSA